MDTKKYAEKFKEVVIVSDAVDVLDEMFTHEYAKFDEIERIRLIRHFLYGLCVGESMSEINENNPFHWFTIFEETIFGMFLDRHGYYLTPDKMRIIKA